MPDIGTYCPSCKLINSTHADKDACIAALHHQIDERIRISREIGMTISVQMLTILEKLAHDSEAMATIRDQFKAMGDFSLLDGLRAQVEHLVSKVKEKDEELSALRAFSKR